MLNFRLGTVNNVHWEFKLVLNYSKPHINITWRRNEKKMCIYSLSNPTT